MIPALVTPRLSNALPTSRTRTEPIEEALQQILGGLSSGANTDPLWDLSTRYHDMRVKLSTNKPLRDWVRYLVIQGIIRRALSVLHSARRPERVVRASLDQNPGDLLLEETTEQILGKPYPELSDLIVQTREPIPLDVAMMLDTSLSMTGKKLALSAVAAVILAHQCEPDGYAIIGFEGRATVIKPLRDKLPMTTVVGRILDVPALGFTNIKDGLGKGSEQLQRGKRTRRVGILLSDGKATEGGCPLQAAGRFRKLHVIMTEDFNMDRPTCHRIAERGGGLVFPISREDDLPRVFYRVIRHALR